MMMPFNTTKQLPRLTDQDIRLLFGAEPTPAELTPTSGSYIEVPSGQSATLARVSVSDLIFRHGRKEIDIEVKAGRTEPGRGYSQEHATERTSADLADVFDFEITILEAAAVVSGTEDASAFVHASSEIDWEARPAGDFAHAVRLALHVGAHLVARELAMKGSNLYPADVELRKMAQILAPAEVTASETPPDPTVSTAVAWLEINWNDYKGRWVALRGGELLAVADSLDELIAQVGDVRHTGILVTSLW
jgi:hypothetical protein